MIPPVKDKKVSVEVFNPKDIKTARLNKIMNVLKANQGKPLYVEEIAYYVGLDPKTTRKYLRLLRAQYPNDIVVVKDGVKTVYLYKPSKEALEELTLKLNRKLPRPQKALVTINVQDAELLKELEDVDLEDLLKELISHLKAKKKGNQQTGQQ
jgi:predicted DNA-binding transcriptional regulator YafY